MTDIIFLLKIRNIREADYGNYTCLASNKYGNDSQTTYLFCKSIWICYYKFENSIPSFRLSKIWLRNNLWLMEKRHLRFPLYSKCVFSTNCSIASFTHSNAFLKICYTICYSILAPKIFSSLFGRKIRSCWVRDHCFIRFIRRVALQL